MFSCFFGRMYSYSWSWLGKIFTDTLRWLTEVHLLWYHLYFSIPFNMAEKIPYQLDDLLCFAPWGHYLMYMQIIRWQIIWTEIRSKYWGHIFVVSSFPEMYPSSSTHFVHTKFCHLYLEKNISFFLNVIHLY